MQPTYLLGEGYIRREELSTHTSLFDDFISLNKDGSKNHEFFTEGLITKIVLYTRIKQKRR